MADELEIDSERSRIRNALVNTGVCRSFAEAEQRLAASRLHIHVSETAATTAAGQAALLTATATAVRCFGEVTVDGRLGATLAVPFPLIARTLASAVTELGGRTDRAGDAARTVLIGPSEGPMGWCVQAHWDGWRAGVVPGNTPLPPGRGDCSLAGVAAGALAVGQAFLAEQGDVRAGRAVQKLSLWEPDATEPDAGPLLASCSFPRAMWLIGLGNLGQAYLWSLTSLPYRRPGEVVVFLQDDDVVNKGNWGTSILAQRDRYGMLKTRVAEEWAERRGFRPRRIDRRLDLHLRRTEQEPAFAIAGLDRMPPRRLLGLPGFEYIVDAGLGATAKDFRSIRISTFGPGDDPAKRFAGVEDQAQETTEELRKLPAYQQVESMPEHGSCGAATLAGQAVAVPFVSSIAGALTIAQAVRVASGKDHYANLTADIADLRTVRAVIGSAPRRLALEVDTAPEA